MCTEGDTVDYCVLLKMKDDTMRPSLDQLGRTTLGSLDSKQSIVMY